MYNSFCLGVEFMVARALPLTSFGCLWFLDCTASLHKDTGQFLETNLSLQSSPYILGLVWQISLRHPALGLQMHTIMPGIFTLILKITSRSSYLPGKYCTKLSFYPKAHTLRGNDSLRVYKLFIEHLLCARALN